ncbi:hypothetical protein F4778DRAFT_714695 [Xylariomycetidae sp. FL2044]|nr:hypothetical protein F4778DRAFT_714695 [Xylariomycetidae sp. FL2044]
MQPPCDDCLPACLPLARHVIETRCCMGATAVCYDASATGCNLNRTTTMLLRSIDPITRSAGAALAATILVQRLHTRWRSQFALELYSEILCWALVPLVFRVAAGATRRAPATPTTTRTTTTSAAGDVIGNSTWKRNDTQALPTSGRYGGYDAASAEGTSAPSLSLWIVALCITTVSVWKTETGSVAVQFLPILTPLLLYLTGYFLHTPSVSSTTSPSLLSALFSPFVSTVWGTSLLASFTLVAILGGGLRGHTLSLIPILALLVCYIFLIHSTTLELRESYSRLLPSFDLQNFIIPVSVRTLVTLAIALFAEVILFGFPLGDIASTSCLGLAKCFSWYFTIQTTRHSHWRIAIALGTFAITCTCDPFAISSDVQALSLVFASLCTLGQLIELLSDQARSKSALWIFGIVPLLPYVLDLSLSYGTPSGLLLENSKHPIQKLIDSANGDFNALIHRQSRTSVAASEEYRRRYRVNPPEGFETWYEYASSHHSPIIDDFDMVHESISPLWQVSGKQISSMMNDVYHAPNSEVWLCRFDGQTAKTRCTHPRRTNDRDISLMFNKLLNGLPDILPSATFLVNHLDEPRVMYPSAPSLEVLEKIRFKQTNLSKRPIWDKLTEPCSSLPEGDKQPKNPASYMTEAQTSGLPVVADTVAAKDLCQHPGYGDIHGLAISPTSFRLIEGFVPVLSTGAPSTMNDILIPSPAYMEPEFAYDESQDRNWDKKSNKLYWSGSTTGGFATGTDSQWQSFHRQRFVALAQGRMQAPRPAAPLNPRHFDVAFTRVFQTLSHSAYLSQLWYFGTRPWTSSHAPLSSKLVFDTDGNGISGRWYRLLASRSLPVKQTLFREWHDERLVPWVHYVPVSMELAELGELIEWFLSDERGREEGRRMADQGREWFGRAFRDVDLRVYVWRLILEMARLQDPERAAGEPGRVDGSGDGMR